MANIVPSPHSASGLPTYLPPLTDRALRTCISRLIPPIEASRTRYAIAPSDAPSDALRGALERRCERIDGWLLPAGPIAATEAYKDLLATMSSGSADEETELRELKGFVEATQKLPLFALKGACAAFRDGVIGDGKWMPRPGQICVEASKRVADLAKEQREIRAVLTAEIRTPQPNAALRAQNLADAAAFVAEGRSMEAASRAGKMTDEQMKQAKILAHALEIMAQGKPDPRPLPPLSPYLRRQLAEAGAIPDTDMVPDGIGATTDAA